MKPGQAGATLSGSGPETCDLTFPTTSHDIFEGEQVPEIWAECDVCNRRFYCERSSFAEGRAQHCPVCGAPADRMSIVEPDGSRDDGGNHRRRTF